MAKRLAIVRPLPATISTVGANLTALTNLATPNPREAMSFTAAGGAWSFDLDLGALKTIDSLFLGYMLAAQPITFDLGTTLGGAQVASIAVVPQASDLYDPRYHAVHVAAAPLAGVRYVRVKTPAAPIADGSAGAVAVGLAFQATWGHEYGAGRPLEDTGIAERLFDGSFGIQDGARIGGYQWTFGDLTDAEVSALWALVKDRGNTRSVLVIEDPDQIAGLNERTHWGLLDRLDAYERQLPGASRYSFKIRDWL
jgi:hypothetical protein